MTPSKVLEEQNLPLRKEIRTLAGELSEMQKKAEFMVVRLSNLVHKVQKKQLFRNWVNPKTKKYFAGFQEWIDIDVGLSKSSVYRFIDVKEHLKTLSDDDLEKVGKSRCFALVKLAKEKPKMLSKIVSEIKKDPSLSVFAVEQKVANMITGHHFDSGKYERLDFAIKAEDVPEVEQAFAVMQALEPVKEPEAPYGRGMHLVALCREYLSGREEREVLKRLETAGHFKKTNGNSNFTLED